MVAVLILPFNRPATAKAVVDALLQNPPSRLYIGADGPRHNNPQDRKSCAEVRDFLSSVDWPCEVFTLYQEENLGAGRAIPRHIDWFFSHEVRGVILEDDCVPQARFLEYCSSLLDHYQSDPRVMCISGFTPLKERHVADASYWFSIFCLSWGWATWKRAWDLYRPRMDGLDSFLAADSFPGAARNPLIAARWTERFRAAQRDPNYYWFIQWTYSCWINNGRTIMPYGNLVRNLGSLDGDKQLPHLSAPDGDKNFGDMTWPLRHPRNLEPDVQLDTEFMRDFYDLQINPSA